MPYQMNDQQFANVTSMTSEERMWHFINQVADWEQLWGVRNDGGWLVPTTPEGIEYFPVWPHPDYAQKTTDQRFPAHRAEEIALDDFLYEWLPQLLDDNVKVAVFPNMDWTFWVIDAGDLAEYLREEKSKYE